MEKIVYEFISKQTNDPIVERKTCAISNKEFPIFQSDLNFYDKISPVFWSPPSTRGVGGIKKYQIPTPTLCPQERERRRMTFRNERKLYKRKCDYTWEDIVSIYSPEKPYKVYKQDIRRSDNRDPIEYWMDFDFSKTFFEQFDELMKSVPQMNLTNFKNENSDYCNYLNDSKDCYLACASGFLEDSLYCNRTYNWKDLVDCGFCFRGENSYMNINCEDFYNSMFCRWCKQTSNCHYCIDCTNCKDCIACINLVSKQYCIFNKQYTKEEYFKEKAELLSKTQYLENKILELESDCIKSNLKIVNSENCFGNNIKNSKNIVLSFEVDGVENAKYCREVMEHKNIMDVNNNGWSELEYEIMWFGYNNKVAFTIYSAECVDVYYSAYCQYSKNLFGCVWLRYKEYCIFNKQYTKSEYEELVPKIIEHMQKTNERGEFFPISISPWWYNETHANTYYPLNKDQAIERWYNWMDIEIPINIPNGLQTIKSIELADDVQKVDKDILNKAIICKTTGKPYRLIAKELEFYKKHNIIIPKEHYDLRYAKRAKYTSDTNLYLLKCDKCDKETLSIHENNKNIYCENCYKKEIYW
jgi:hypothetical protein